jgi:hypothetical protein
MATRANGFPWPNDEGPDGSRCITNEAGFGVGSTAWKNNGGNCHTEDQTDAGLKRQTDPFSSEVTPDGKD